ncbi:MAG: helix-turn-helix transcriptional regulator [Proteiniphilum sp.]|nr:helix-turn-helix transcriptional regulator [Proteiniphilum sp.]
METNASRNVLHLGRNIERIRRLQGMTQSELGRKLGVSKQAVSKMEQKEKIDEAKLPKISYALGVTVEGLKYFSDQTVFCPTPAAISAVKPPTATTPHASAPAASKPTDRYPHRSFLEPTVKLYEELIRLEKEFQRVAHN